MRPSAKAGFDALAILLAGALYYLAYPHVLTAYRDDFIVWPERAWFPGGGWPWLDHLLWFNQTRYTYTGDVHLFRPGLFAADDLYFAVLRPLAPWALPLALGCANLFVFYGVYRFVSAILGQDLPARIAAVGLALLFLLPLRGGMLFIWPEIEPYALAIGLYAFAAGLLIQAAREPPLTTRISLTAALLFFAAAFFHESAVGALGLLAGYLALSWAVAIGQRGASDLFGPPREWLWSPAVALAAYALVRVPAFFLLGEGQWRHGGDALFAIGDRWHAGSLTDFIAKSPLQFAGLLLAGAICAAVLWMALRRLRRPSAEAGLTLAIFLSLVIIVGAGRVLPRGFAADWYRPMFIFAGEGLLAVCLFAASNYLGRWRAPLLIVVALAAGLGGLDGIRATRALSEDYWARNGDTIRASQRIRAAIDRDANGICFAGARGLAGQRSSSGFITLAEDGSPEQGPERMLSLLLLDRICGAAPGTPMVFTVGAGATIGATQPLPPAALVQPIDLSRRSADITLPPGWLPAYEASNIHTTKYGESDPVASFAWRFADIPQPVEVDAVVRSDDTDPIMYNVAIALGLGQDDQNIVAAKLVDGSIILAKGSGDGATMVMGYIPAVTRSIALRLIDVEDGCEAFVNGFLAARLPDCRLPAGAVGVASWDNGTPAETVSSIAYAPAAAITAPPLVPTTR